MGCDIHVIAEVKENGIWKRNTDEVFKNPWYDPERWEKHVDNLKKRLEAGEITQKQFDDWSTYDSLNQTKKFVIDPSSNRNYDWFAILANVRNGRGFAGLYTGSGFDVIAEPRGYPENISNEGMKFFSYSVTDDPEKIDNEIKIDGQWVYYVDRQRAINWVTNGYSQIIKINGQHYVTNPDYHSVSYLTVEDFNNFDWNQVTMKYGVVTLDQYKELRNKNKTPELWSGGISGEGIITVSVEEADRILSGEVFELKRNNSSLFNSNAEPTIMRSDEWKKIYVGYEWAVTYREWFKHKIENTIEPLRKLAEKYDDARIVFSFDN